MKSLQPFVFAITILLMGVVFTLLGLYAQSKRETMARDGVSLTGQIVGGKADSSGQGSTKYYLHVAWTQEGAQRLQYFTVQHDFYLEHMAGTSWDEKRNQVTAAEVPIRTLPGHPDEAVLAGGSTDNFGMQYLGYGLFVLAAFLFYRAFRRVRAQAVPA